MNPGYEQILSKLCLRGTYLGTGCMLGAATLFPNMMMSDSGTPAAKLAANMGIIASGSFVVCGSISAVRLNPVWLLPAFAMQASAFIIHGLLIDAGLVSDIRPVFNSETSDADPQ